MFTRALLKRTMGMRLGGSGRSAGRSSFWKASCVFRMNVTVRFGNVTADFGIVTGRFGDRDRASFDTA
jgi:hypothetical protein